VTNPSAARAVTARERRAAPCPSPVSRLRPCRAAAATAAESEGPTATDAHPEEGRLGPLALARRGRAPRRGRRVGAGWRLG